jgi:hypothetical protein
MKILTNFQDYYDGCALGMCGEKDLVLERYRDNKYINEQSEEGKLRKEIKKVFQKYSYGNERNIYKNQVMYSFVIVGDIIVPFFTIRNYIISVGYKSIVAYSIEELEEKINILNKDEYLRFELNKLDKKWLNNFLTKNWDDLLKSLRVVTKEPLISYSLYKDNLDGSIAQKVMMESMLEINPILKKLELIKKLSPEQIIQELEMYLRKEKNQEKEVFFSNKEKIVQQGFDLKTSFRKTI